MIFSDPVGLTRQHSIEVQDTLDLKGVIYLFTTTRFLSPFLFLFVLIVVITIFSAFTHFFYLGLASLPITFIYISRIIV